MAQVCTVACCFVACCCILIPDIQIPHHRSDNELLLLAEVDFDRINSTRSTQARAAARIGQLALATARGGRSIVASRVDAVVAAVAATFEQLVDDQDECAKDVGDEHGDDALLREDKVQAEAFRQRQGKHHGAKAIVNSYT